LIQLRGFTDTSDAVVFEGLSDSTSESIQNSLEEYLRGAVEKSNPLTCFANSLATDYNFLMKLIFNYVKILGVSRLKSHNFVIFQDY